MDAATIDLLHFQRTALQKLQALLQIEAGDQPHPVRSMVSYARIRSRLQVLSILSEVGSSQHVDAVSMIARLVKVTATLFGVPEADQSITVSSGQFEEPVSRTYALTLGLLIVECLCALLERGADAPIGQRQIRAAADGQNRIVISATPSDVALGDKEFPTVIARLLAEEIACSLDVEPGNKCVVVIGVRATKYAAFRRSGGQRPRRPVQHVPYKRFQFR